MEYDVTHIRIRRLCSWSPFNFLPLCVHPSRIQKNSQNLITHIFRNHHHPTFPNPKPVVGCKFPPPTARGSSSWKWDLTLVVLGYSLIFPTVSELEESPIEILPIFSFLNKILKNIQLPFHTSKNSSSSSPKGNLHPRCLASTHPTYPQHYLRRYPEGSTEEQLRHYVARLEQIPGIRRAEPLLRLGMAVVLCQAAADEVGQFSQNRGRKFSWKKQTPKRSCGEKEL